MNPLNPAREVPFLVDSDLDLGPWAAPWLRASGADVTVRRGPVPTTLLPREARGVYLKSSPGRVLVAFRCGVRFVVEGGESIRYEVDPGATTGAGTPVTDVDLRAFFWGIPFAALVLQRGLLAIHTSAVSVGQDVFAFTGSSGAGKSTLAAALAGRGYSFFADDLLVVDPDAGSDELPCWGIANLKLFPDALGLVRAVGTERVRSGGERVKRYAEPERRANRHAGTLRGLGILIAGPVDGPARYCRVDRLSARHAVEACLHALYQPTMAFAVSGSPRLFEQSAAMARHTDVFEFRRPMGHRCFQEGVAHLVRALPMLVAA